MQTDDDGFAALWPTLFLRRMLPGHEHANAVLVELITSLDAEAASLTTDYRASNLFSREHPALEWLRKCVARTALDYLARSGVDYKVPLTLHGWANVNRRGDYHDLHNHPHSYLSGTYYVAVPEQPARAAARSDLSPGAISFFDPRPQANMTAIRGDGQVDPETTVLPAAGTIMMWPSFVHHLVHPNFADDARISISFNVVVPNAADHLPAD